MARIHVFADEAGNFDFSRRPGASRYFILTTVTLEDNTIGDELLALRRQLAWEGVEMTPDFHATEEAQVVRDRVFALLAAHTFRVDATVIEKAKVYPRLQSDELRFYQTAWYLHLKYFARQIVRRDDELLVITASIGTKKKMAAFHQAVTNVVSQVSPTTSYRTACWMARSDPCLQVADYCCWAIQRKWERGDARSHALIAPKIHSEFDVFATSATLYY